MKTNITLSIDKDLVREARLIAAQQGTSISGLLAQQLEDLIRRDRGYESAMRRAMNRLATGYDLSWTPPESRDELYER